MGTGSSLRKILAWASVIILFSYILVPFILNIVQPTGKEFVVYISLIAGAAFVIITIEFVMEHLFEYFRIGKSIQLPGLTKNIFVSLRRTPDSKASVLCSAIGAMTGLLLGAFIGYLFMLTMGFVQWIFWGDDPGPLWFLVANLAFTLLIPVILFFKGRSIGMSFADSPLSKSDSPL